MNRSFGCCRNFTTSFIRPRSIRYIKPDQQRKKDKEKLKEFEMRMRQGMKGALPKSYHQKMRHVQADQRHWDNMSGGEQAAHIDHEERPYHKIINNIDEWKKRKRSNIYQPQKIVSIPGTGTQTLISCSGSGDAEKFNILQNQRYQTFDSIPLFSSKFHGRPGRNVQSQTAAQNRRDRRPQMDILAVEGNSSLSNVTFLELGINPRICDALYKMYGIRYASTIQCEIINNFFQSDTDIIGISETGSGKTLSYLVPMLHAYLETGATSLIVTTHGLLRQQIYRAVFDLLLHMDNLNPTDVIGAGTKLHTAPIGISYLFAQNLINSANGNRQFLILDEADEAFSSEYIERAFELHESVSDRCRTICLQPFRYSTTQWPQIKERFNNATLIETEHANRVPLHISQSFKYLRHEEKEREIVNLLRDQPMPTILFANRYSEMHHITRLLEMYKLRFATVERRSNNNLRVIDSFDKGEVDILVGTDNISRGINLQRPRRVINWAPPFSLADYLNRIGRCGRLNHSNIAHIYTFISDTKNGALQLQKLEEAVRRHTKLHQIDKNFNYDQNLKIQSDRK